MLRSIASLHFQDRPDLCLAFVPGPGSHPTDPAEWIELSMGRPAALTQPAALSFERIDMPE